MSTDNQTFSSPNDFWQHTQGDQHRKFYTAWCLLETAVYDYFTGSLLLNKGNYSWSIAAFYYSLLHSARIACFLVFGDYPSGHTEIANLLGKLHIKRSSVYVKTTNETGEKNVKEYKVIGINNEHTILRLKSNDSIEIEKRRSEIIELHKPKTWIKQLKKSKYADFSRIDPLDEFSRQEIISYFIGQDSDITSKLEKIGNLLSIAREIRNDSTYEGLLSAHQYDLNDLSEVTEKFKGGSGDLKDLSKEVLRLGVNLIKFFIENQIEHQGEYYSFLNSNDWGIGRIRSSMRSKDMDSNLIEEFNNVLEPLFFHSRFTSEPTNFLNSIDRTIFMGKNELMKDFKLKIEELHDFNNPY